MWTDTLLLSVHICSHLLLCKMPKHFHKLLFYLQYNIICYNYVEKLCAENTNLSVIFLANHWWICIQGNWNSVIQTKIRKSQQLYYWLFSWELNYNFAYFILFSSEKFLLKYLIYHAILYKRELDRKKPPKSVIMRITTNSRNRKKGGFLWNK